MKGALLQLIAYGAQDVYLTGRPETSFFKNVYLRHTNFSIESIEVPYKGIFNFDSKINCNIPKIGDLIGPVYFETKLPNTGNSYRSWDPWVGFSLLKETKLKIGGQIIDTQDGYWNLIWSQLTHKIDKKNLLREIVGWTNNAEKRGKQTKYSCATDYPKLTVPLFFFFCRHNSLYLPLISLEYHDVEIDLEFKKLEEIIIGKTREDYFGGIPQGNLSNGKIWIDYIFLDTNEREKFAKNSHEYLVETVQSQVNSLVQNNINNINLNFNHPIKELLWISYKNITGYNKTNGSRTFDDFTNSHTGDQWLVFKHSLDNMKLILNGMNRMNSKDYYYYNYYQPYHYHSCRPLTGIYCYSFSLEPEKIQPSGTCNFSRFESAILQLDNLDNDEIRIYAHGYNVLRIASGMGGLAYSN